MSGYGGWGWVGEVTGLGARLLSLHARVVQPGKAETMGERR